LVVEKHLEILFCWMNAYQPALLRLFQGQSIRSASQSSTQFFVSERDLLTCFDIHYYLLESRLIEYYGFNSEELEEEISGVNPCFQLSLFKDFFKTDEPYIEFLYKRIDDEWPDSKRFTNKGLSIILEGLRLFPKYQILHINSHIVAKNPYILQDEYFMLSDQDIHFLRENELCF